MKYVTGSQDAIFLTRLIDFLKPAKESEVGDEHHPGEWESRCLLLLIFWELLLATLPPCRRQPTGRYDEA